MEVKETPLSSFSLHLRLHPPPPGAPGRSSGSSRLLRPSHELDRAPARGLQRPPPARTPVPHAVHRPRARSRWTHLAAPSTLILNASEREASASRPLLNAPRSSLTFTCVSSSKPNPGAINDSGPAGSTLHAHGQVPLCPPLPPWPSSKPALSPAHPKPSLETLLPKQRPFKK